MTITVSIRITSASAAVTTKFLILLEVSEHLPTPFCLTKHSKWSTIGPAHFAITLLVKVTEIDCNWCIAAGL